MNCLWVETSLLPYLTQSFRQPFPNMKTTSVKKPYFIDLKCGLIEMLLNTEVTLPYKHGIP